MSPIRATRNGFGAVWRVVPLRAVLVVLGCYVAYLVVANLLLATGALRSLLNRAAPEHVHFEWSSAYSPYPFRLEARDFVLTGQDSSVSWRIAFDRAHASFDLHDFFEHRVHMRSAAASGVSVAFHSKPSKPHGPSNPKDLWSVELDECDADDVREVVVDAVRVTDHGGIAHGGFTFEPERRIDVPRTTYRAGDAKVELRGNPVVSEIVGAFSFAIDDHRIGSGPILPEVDASAAAQAMLGDLRALSPEISGGAGSIELRAAVARGHVENGSTLRATSDRWLLVSDRDAVLASSRLAAHVEGGTLLANFETHGATLARDGWVVARIPTLTAVLDSRDLDLARPFERWSIALDVPSASLPHLEQMNRYVGSRLFSEGTARASLHAKIGPHVVTEVRAEVSDVRMKGVTGWWITATAAPVRYSLGRSSWATGTFAGRMRDASLPLAMLGASKLLRKAVPGGKFTFRGDVHAGTEGFSVTRGSLAGRDVDVLGHYEHDARGDRGDALVETPAGKLGVRISGDGTEVVPGASRAWFEGT